MPHIGKYGIKYPCDSGQATSPKSSQYGSHIRFDQQPHPQPIHHNHNHHTTSTTSTTSNDDATTTTATATRTAGGQRDGTPDNGMSPPLLHFCRHQCQRHWQWCQQPQ